ncbi:MAG: alpha/beta fold hydrolase [Acidimicrobiia bacterium]
MRRSTPVLLAAAVAASVLALPGATPEASATAPLVELPVTFTVQNTNTTSVPCTSDGETYEVKGHIVGVQGDVEPGAVDTATLYLHAVNFGEYYWRIPVDGYDYASEQAYNGHVSVTIDRLGYGNSGQPDAAQGTCFGSEADVAHQIVDQLKSGDYTVDGGEPLTFSKVFVGGSSVGAMTANIASFTYGNIDGLINFGFGDFAVGPFAFREYNEARGRCFSGGDSSSPGATPFAKDDQEQFHYFSAPEAVRAALPASAPDPCGQLESIPQAIGADMEHLNEIDVPVLLIFGDKDEAFPPPAGQITADRYSGSPSVTLFEPKDTSHFPLVEATQDETVEVVDEWLKEHG